MDEWKLDPQFLVLGTVCFNNIQWQVLYGTATKVWIATGIGLVERDPRSLQHNGCRPHAAAILFRAYQAWFPSFRLQSRFFQWSLRLLGCHVHPVKGVRTWWHCLHRPQKATAHLSTLVPSHLCHDLLLVQLHWSHRPRSLVHGDELSRPFLHVHLLCSQGHAIQDPTMGERCHHINAAPPDDHRHSS